MAGSDWAALYRLARTDKGKAFQQYQQFYLGTSGQVYWSDAHQLSNVFEGYNEAVESKPETEMITEIYVRADSLIPLMVDVRRDFVKHHVDMTYGTIQFIEPDTESHAQATERLVCIVCNLRIMHTRPEKARTTSVDHRPCHRVWRSFLPDLSSLGDSRSGRPVTPSSAVPGRQAST